jgi:hypothetical protein
MVIRHEALFCLKQFSASSIPPSQFHIASSLCIL